MTDASRTRNPAFGEPEIPALPPGTRLTTLENGLTIIVCEDRSAPVVSAQAWCRAGSIDEGSWLGAGLSHLLEHMLFKGTTTRGAGRIDQEIQDVGGSMNAYTSFDRTVYYINVPNTGAVVAIDILCDIMQHATLPDDEMTKEKQVILREMDMNQDDPGRRAGRRLFETAYTRSPYRYTVIGYPDIFNQVTREDVLGYYREKYAPNNTFFVVVGDIRADEAIEQIRAAYQSAKAKPLAPVALPEEPRQAGQREVVEEGPVELGHFHFAWHIPDIRHPDVPVLDVLATILGSGQSSRLYQQVRETQGVVHSVDAFTYSPGNPGLFGMSAVVDADQFTPARRAMLAELDRIKADSVLPSELVKAVKQFTAGTLATLKTMQGQAQDLGGNWMSANDLNFSQRYLAAVKRVGPADIQRVACQYLTPENRSLYALLPRGSIQAQGAVAEAPTVNPVQKIDLPNGLRLLVQEDNRLPFVEFRAVFQGGVLAETTSDNGLSNLLAKMLLKGTQSRNAEQIVTEMESLGGSIDCYSANNSLGLSAEVLSEDFEKGLELMADVLLRPTFPEAPLERERQVQLASIKAQRDHLLFTASQAMRRELFGEVGYGLDVNGNEESVGAVQREQLTAFFQKLLVPDNCVLAIFGDVTTSRVKAAVESCFAGWKASGHEIAVSKSGEAPVEVRRVVEFRDKKQAVLMIGFPGLSLFDQDRFALDLLQEALSDLGSRLFVRIRDQLGLAYYVGAQNFVGLQPGYFGFYAGTSPEKAELVESEFFAETRTLCSGGLTADELKRAKAKVIGHKKIARQDIGAYAMTVALDELYGLGYHQTELDDAQYEAVTLEDVQRVIRRFFNPDACIVAWVKPDPAKPEPDEE